MNSAEGTKISKSYRIDVDTISKINTIKNQFFIKTKKNISYGDIIDYIFQYVDNDVLVEYISTERETDR